MGIFRSIETECGDIGWSYSQFSHFAELVWEKCQDVIDGCDKDVLDSFLSFAEGRMDKQSLVKDFEELIDFDEFGDNDIPWELCEEVEPLLRKIVQLPSFVETGHQDMAIALCDRMRQCADTFTSLEK